MNSEKYDYLIVGCGLAGSMCAHVLTKQGKKCLVIDKRSTIGGNLYCLDYNGITVHRYGAHIFHTSNERVWNFVNELVEFEPFINSPIALFDGCVYNLPFNMNTFTKIWPDIHTPEEAKNRIKEEIDKENITEIKNLEDKALSLVGRTIYEKLIKGYTEKQWGRPCNELPSYIITRLPLRFTFDNNYFNDTYQGIPKGGYNKLIEKLLEGSKISLQTDFEYMKKNWKSVADKLIYTGKIDEYFDYKYGELEWRSLQFQDKTYELSNFQGNAVVNHTGSDKRYTRTIEHKYFSKNTNDLDYTIVTYEYPSPYTGINEPYYPIVDERNTKLSNEYLKLAQREDNVSFFGRLAEYRYYDMDDIIERILNIFE